MHMFLCFNCICMYYYVVCVVFSLFFLVSQLDGAHLGKVHVA